MNKASIQVDIDSFWAILNLYYDKPTHEGKTIYETGVKRCLEIFKKFNIKATFFVIGKDVMLPENRHVISTLLTEGHEIANHSMDHMKTGFDELSRDGKYSQITDCHNIVKHYFGIDMSGFKAPAYAVDAETLEILEEKKYVYDSSVYFVSLKPLMRAIQKFKLGQATSRYHWGTDFPNIPPLKPYHPHREKFWKSGDSKLVEFGINTIPFIRLPFHCSFVYSTSGALFDAGFWSTKALGLPLNYAFHAIDFVDPKEVDPRILKRPGVNMPLEKKVSMTSAILKRITDNYEVVPTRHLIDDYLTLKRQ